MKICAGAVTYSKIPILVQGFSNVLILRDQNSQSPSVQEAADPITLGNALLELMKVSRGTIRSIAVEGGMDCGWLATIAEWLLDLRVSIVSRRGQFLYSQLHDTGDSHTQVNFIR